MEEIPSQDRSVSLSKSFEAEPLAPSWDSSGMWSQTVLKFAAVREKRCLPKSLRELFYLKYPVFDVGTVFPFHSEDEIVDRRILEETWAIVGRRVISRRRDSIQGLGIGVESHEGNGYQKKGFIEKC